MTVGLWRELARRHDLRFFASGWGHRLARDTNGAGLAAYLRRPRSVQVEPRVTEVVLPPPLPALPRRLGSELAAAALRQSILLSCRLRGRWLQRYLRAEGVEPDVLFVVWPQDLPLCGYVPAAVRCVRVVDEVSLYPSYAGLGHVIERLEYEHLPRYDFVYCSSRSQAERRAWHPHVRFVPNGVDYAAYATAPSDEPVPQELAGLPRPRLAFFGQIHNKLDYPLLEAVADSFSQASLVLIGPLTDHGAHHGARLLSRPNVRHLGERPRDDLPRYVRGIDVSLVPYVLNESTHTMLAMKVPEHLAAGKPIVTTDLAELRPLADVLYIARTHRQFIAAIRHALEADDSQAVRARQDAARELSWDRLVQPIEADIEGFLQRAMLEPTSVEAAAP